MYFAQANVGKNNVLSALKYLAATEVIKHKKQENKGDYQ